MTAYRMHTFQRNIALGVAGVICMSLLALVASVGASDASVVTVHADDEKHVITTSADTVKDVLDRVGVEVASADLVEPSRDTEITSQTFNVNVYRARPVVIEDTDRNQTYRTRTAYQSPRLIVQKAEAVKVHEKDAFDLRVVTDFINSDFIGHKVVIDRATPVNVTLVNRETVIRTHAATVREMFKQADVKVGENDIVKPGLNAPIQKDMDISLTRVGHKTITKEKTIEPPTRVINNNDKPLGYEKVKKKGESGLALVTYEVEYRNGTIVNRKQVHRVVERKPKSRVVIMGRKFSLDRAFAQLRLCESGGDYSAVNRNPEVEDYVPEIHDYYGAYQFNQNTWDANAPAEYKGKRPDTVEAAIQDKVALSLYKERGWQPWPRCGAGLPHQ